MINDKLKLKIQMSKLKTIFTHISHIKKQAGFSLVECLVAVGIISIAFIILIQILGSGLNISRHQKQASQALLFAQARIEELFLTGYDEITSSQGAINNNFYQQTTVSNYSSDVKQIEVEVCWVPENECQSLKTLIAKK